MLESGQAADLFTASGAGVWVVMSVDDGMDHTEIVAVCADPQAADDAARADAARDEGWTFDEWVTSDDEPPASGEDAASGARPSAVLVSSPRHPVHYRAECWAVIS